MGIFGKLSYDCHCLFRTWPHPHVLISALLPKLDAFYDHLILIDKQIVRLVFERQ